MSGTSNPLPPIGPFQGPSVQAPAVPQGGGLVRAVTPSALADMDALEESNKRAVDQARLKLSDETQSDLANYVRSQFETMKRHRQSATGWNDRLMTAMRTFQGEYDPDILREIEGFGGSKIFARLVAIKCRGATALLRDIYLTAFRPWGIGPTPEPTMPDSIQESVMTLLTAEASTALMGGQPADENALSARKKQLEVITEQAGRNKARKEAKRAERRLDDLLVEGGFYTALAEFLVDLPLFPFAVIKGPVVRISPHVRWENKKAVIKDQPKMFWERVSPFDLYWTGGASKVDSADFVERQRLSRADINGLLDVPGYDRKNIEKVLEEYGESGYVEAWDTVDSARADSENRENPQMNESGMIDCLEFNGSIQGKLLREYGMDSKKVPDEKRDYFVTLWMIGRHVIKVQLSPSPRKRVPYYISSFEKVPGTIAGNALPEILADVQGLANACLRSLVNNLSLASGPQVVVNDDRLGDQANSDDIYPWKVWHVSDPVNGAVSSTLKPIDFFQPNSNAQELMAIVERCSVMADELSGIPRYITGSGNGGGGAGRTASGLAMLMNNASKILQTVAANIDRDVFEPLITQLYDILMLTSPGEEGTPGALRGDESIEVKGVVVAIQRETERQRQLEFLQITNNPTDLEITGVKGRASVLRNVSETLGMDGSQIVPSEEDMEQKQIAMEVAQAQAQAMASLQQQPGQIPGEPPESGASPAELGRQSQGSQQGGENTGPKQEQGPRTNLQQQIPRG